MTPPWQRRRYAVVAEHAADLFHEVFGNRHIQPENGRQHVPLAVPHHLHVKSEADQDRLGLFQWDVHAKHLVHDPGLEPHAHRLLRSRIHVWPLLVHRAAGELCDERRGAPRPRKGQLGRKSALEPSRRLGSEPNGSRRLPDAWAAERGRFEQDVRGGGRDSGLLAAYDSSDGDRTLCVRDHQHCVVQLPHDAVEAKQLLAGACTPDLDLRALQPREIEDVQRLRVLEEHVIRDVDEGVDRPHPAGAKPAAKPFRARPDLDSFDHARDVPAAELRVFDAHLHELAPGGSRRAGERGHEIALERAAESRGQLASDTQVTHAVGPVGRDFDFHHRIARDHGRERVAWRSGVKNEDARVVVAEEQLVGGAEHPARLKPGDVHVPDQLPVWNSRPRQRDGHESPGDRVRRAGDDLLHATSAEVDLVHPQVVARFRVLLLFEDLANHDLRKVDERQRLDLEAKACEHVSRVLG